MAAPKSQLPLIIMASVSATMAVAAVSFIFIQGGNPFKFAPPAEPAQQIVTHAAAPTPTPLPTPFGTKLKTFTYKNPDAKSVQITGNFDQWQPEPMDKNSNGTWTYSKELPKGAIIEYQFVVDGTKMPDPQKRGNTVPDDAGILKSVFTIPKDEPTQEPRIVRATPEETPVPAPTAIKINPTTMGGGVSLPATGFSPATATATPPQAVDLNALAATPGDWPKTVTLKQAGVVFPVIINGQASGEIQAPMGMQVKLVKVTADRLTVSLQGSEQTVPVSATDLIERVQASRKNP